MSLTTVNNSFSPEFLKYNLLSVSAFGHIHCSQRKATDVNQEYEGRAKSSVTNRPPSFYHRYNLKCFIALEWCVK